jgi:hypothetical protein
MSITNALNYAKLTWGVYPTDSVNTVGYPALTLGAFLGASANVTGLTGGNPFYELAFTDASDTLGQTLATDQILMIEFQGSTVSGSTMGLDPNATEFSLYDNTSGVYLKAGQADVNTVAGWLAFDPALTTESLQEIRIGQGLAGGSGPAQSATVNSFDITTASAPEPSSVILLVTMLLAVAFVTRKRIVRDL